MNIIITERIGDREHVHLGGISCPSGVVIPPASSDRMALGCVFTQTVDLMNATDNTYCRILMQNGAVVDFSGAIPAELIALGVILAVDVYRLDGGHSLVDFAGYHRICLAGIGRLFYLDARHAPRISIALPTEQLGDATCGWIPAAGTLVLTHP